MLTGTPLDLTPFGPLVSLLGLTYWLLALGVAGLAFGLPKAFRVKVSLAVIVFAAFLLPVFWQVKTRTHGMSESRAHLEQSMAHFVERCNTAGEKINRMVDDVEGIVWMKWREKISNADNFADQWKLNDPYGQDCGAEDCIANLLRITSGAALLPDEAGRHATGYRFVETMDPRDGQRYRYRASIRITHQRTLEQLEQYKKNSGGRDPGLDVFGFAIDREPIATFSTPYGVLWDDISTNQDREHWVAGGSLRVIDLRTNEILGERVGYMIDRGQGSQAGGRSPWAAARDKACPAFRTSPDGRAYFDPVSAQFAHRVLRPTASKD